MFLRRNRRVAGGETYEYWTFVASARTKDGPRQRTVASLGMLPGLDEEARMGWEHIRDVLDGRLPRRRSGTDQRLRTVSQPEQNLAFLLQKLELPLTNKPKLI